MVTKNIEVKLSELVEALDRVNVDEQFYVNFENGKIICVNNMGAYYIHNLEFVDFDEPFDKFISLPTQYEINEYKIMKNFIHNIENEQIRNQLFITIQGSGAFRRFKDSCINYNIIDKWYDYKKQEYFDIAKEWCIHNNIEFTNN